MPMFEHWAAENYGMVQEQPAGPTELPASTKLPLERANPLLSCAISKWLRVHGKTVKPKLTAEQQANLRLCFKMMDADGSGAVDAEELESAFKLLGLQISKREVEALLAEVDRDGSGEVEYPEFLEIMTSTLHRLAQEKEEDEAAAAAALARAAAVPPHAVRGRGAGSSTGGAGASATGEPDAAGGRGSEGGAEEDKDGGAAAGAAATALPFDVVATAYRRKKLMEALVENNMEFILSVAKVEEAERKKQEADAAAAAAAATARQRHPSAARPARSPRQAADGGASPAAQPSLAASLSAASLGGAGACAGAPPAKERLPSHGSFLNSLSKEERRIIDQLSRKYPDYEEESGEEQRPRQQHAVARTQQASPHRGRRRGAASPHLAALQAGAREAGAAAAAASGAGLPGGGARGAGAAPPLLAKWSSRSPGSVACRAPEAEGPANEGGSPMLVRYSLNCGPVGAVALAPRSLQHEQRQVEEGLFLLAPQFSRPQA